MNKITGLVLLIIFTGMVGYMLYAPDSDFGTRYYIQITISGLGAAYLLISEFWKPVYNFFKNFNWKILPDDCCSNDDCCPDSDDCCPDDCCSDSDDCCPNSGETEMETDLKRLLSYEDENLCDFIALSYIRDRCAEIGSTEALDHISAINSILFESSNKSEEE